MASIERRVSHDARIAETYTIEFSRKDQQHRGFPAAMAALRQAWTEVGVALGTPNPGADFIDADAVEITDTPRSLPQ